jgi:Bifunctional DNA primase/polymerase, N-terminal
MTSRPEIPHEIDRDAVLATALRLAAADWPVFPCVPGEKRPLTAHGMLDATTDPARIRAWWRRTPRANLAIPTGVASVDVLDVEVRPDGTGYPAFHRLKRAGLLAGNSHVVATPSGGLHVYFTGTDQPSARLPALHLDLKAAGGYVLVPPSVVDHRRYELVRRSCTPVTPLDWDAVRAILDPPNSAAPRATTTRDRSDRGPHGAGHSIAALAGWVEGLPEGRRNAGTYWAACRALEQGVDDLAPLVAAAVRAGLPEREAARTVQSAAQRLHPATRPTPSGRRPVRRAGS